RDPVHDQARAPERAPRRARCFRGPAVCPPLRPAYPTAGGPEPIRLRRSRTLLSAYRVDDALGGLVVLVDDHAKLIEHLPTLVDHALELHDFDVAARPGRHPGDAAARLVGPTVQGL